MPDQPEPIPLRFLDIIFAGHAPYQALTLWPTDTYEILPDRILVTFREKSQERFMAFLDHVAFIRESEGTHYPLPVDEAGRPVNLPFKNFEEYRQYRETRGQGDL